MPNHFSDQHPWFQAALAAAPGSPERDRFIFREGRGEHGELPPNNWPSVFGGPAWHRIGWREPRSERAEQWYLHIFAPEQPDLNWANPEVPAEFERIMRFWLDRGVDGFRIDVAHGDGQAGGPARHGSLDHARTAPKGPRCLRGSTRAGTRTASTSTTAGSGGCSTPTPATGWRSARRGWPTTSGWPATSGPDELNLTFNFRLVAGRMGRRLVPRRDLDVAAARWPRSGARHLGARPTTM